MIKRFLFISIISIIIDIYYGRAWKACPKGKPFLKILFSLAERRADPTAQQTGRVYPKYCGKNTRQNAPQPAKNGLRKKSARPVSMVVQILLLNA
jgi:hypothetical protein